MGIVENIFSDCCCDWLWICRVSQVFGWSKLVLKWIHRRPSFIGSNFRNSWSQKRVRRLSSHHCKDHFYNAIFIVIQIAPNMINSDLQKNISEWDPRNVRFMRFSDGNAFQGVFSNKFSLFLSCYAYCYGTRQGVTGDTQDFFNTFRNREISTSNRKRQKIPDLFLERFGSFRFDGAGDLLLDYVVARLRSESGMENDQNTLIFSNFSWFRKHCHCENNSFFFLSEHEMLRFGFYFY